MRSGRFLLILLVLSLPFWALAQWVQFEALPGLPVSGLMAFVPALAAVLLRAGEGGGAGVRALLGRVGDAGRMRRRLAWAPLVALMPAIALANWAVEAHGPGSGAPAWAPLAMLAAFFVAGAGEELGWTGYLLEPWAERWGELRAGLVIGLIWAAWHLIPFLQADRPPDWIAWQCAKTIAVRVVMVRLYFGGGRSLFAVILFHALDNVAAFSLPNYGAIYDPRLTTLALAAVALAPTLFRGRRV